VAQPKLKEFQQQKAKVISLPKQAKVCKTCGKVLGNLDNIDELLCHSCKVNELSEEFPDVPTEIYDIEASEEMANMYYETFGY